MNYSLTIYQTKSNIPALDDFEDALQYSKLRYSMRHVLLTGAATADDLYNALQKCMQVCRLAGMDSKEHFRQIFVVDETTGATHTDWLMSKKGFCLMMMNLPLNEQTAKWLWEMAEV